MALVAAAAPAAAKDGCADSLATSETFAKALGAVMVAPGVDVPAYEVTPLTKPPQPLEFLDLAEEAGFEGKVVVLLVIAPDGAILDRVITCASPFGYFEPQVLDWVKGYKFGPLPADMPVHYRRYIITVNFLFD